MSCIRRPDDNGPAASPSGKRGMTHAERPVSRGQALADVTMIMYHDLSSRAHTVHRRSDCWQEITDCGRGWVGAPIERLQVEDPGG